MKRLKCEGKVGDEIIVSDVFRVDVCSTSTRQTRRFYGVPRRSLSDRFTVDEPTQKSLKPACVCFLVKRWKKAVAACVGNR